MGAQGFFIALGIFGCVCIPYIYLAFKLNFQIQEDPNKGDHEYPKFTDLWITVLGGFFCVCWEQVTDAIVRPLFEKLSKGDDAKMKKFYTDKMCRNAYKVQYFTASSVWGYYVLNQTGWLPW